MKKRLYYILFFLPMLLAFSCKKMVEVNPPANDLASNNVYASNNTAASVISGMYSTLSGNNFITGFNVKFAYDCGLSADELTYYSTNALTSQFYSNNLSATASSPIIPFWSEMYESYIYTCNDVLANLPNNNVVPEVSNQLLGEARFTRAFFYFYLTNCWGQIPLLTSTNYNQNRLATNADTAIVYTQIKQDLLKAKQLLKKNYLGPDALTVTADRTYPNYWAAAALLARVYLYQKDYSNAYKQADSVIKNTAQYQLQNDLNQVFLGGNNTEAIWQLQPVATNYDTWSAYFYILKKAPSSNGQGYVTLSPFLLSSFEAGDQRRTNWVHDTTIKNIQYSYAYKYKINTPTSSKTEYTTVLRLAEQYLIRAEAQALGTGVGDGLLGAEADLNMIRKRAGLPNYNGPMTATSLEAAIMHERQVELFTEFGHRWLDLKRTGTINSVMSTVCATKNGSWTSFKALWPIPYADIIKDSNLKQNIGY